LAEMRLRSTPRAEKHADKKPRRSFLVFQFSVLSFIGFIIVGYVVLSFVRPALEGFAIREKESATVVFANRNANQLLNEEDFIHPLSLEQKERMSQFIKSLAIRGVLRIYITDAAGTVVFSQPQDSTELSLADNADVKFAIERRRATARFEEIAPQEREIIGASEALVEAVPITFGGSYEVSGVVYIVSRVGFIKKQIEETQEEVAIRIIGSLMLLYVFLFVVVLRASHTIRNQAKELTSYARTLERRVHERTRKLEETTSQQVKQAKELARLKDEFVFVAAHELKAPITHLRWTLDEFFSSPDLQKRADPKVSNIMQVVKRASESLTNLVQDLLNVARLESGTVKISVHPTDLISIIQDIVLQFKPEAESKGIALSFRYDTAKKYPFAMSDSERLKEVFSNFISNALKFNKKDGKIEVGVAHVGDFLETRVADTGLGMDEQELRKLFTKFWRAHSEIEGTGLGMWISKQLVTRMHGDMKVESKKGIGTTFIVRLPVAKKGGVDDAKPVK